MPRLLNIGSDLKQQIADEMGIPFDQVNEVVRSYWFHIRSFIYHGMSRHLTIHNLGCMRAQINRFNSVFSWNYRVIDNAYKFIADIESRNPTEAEVEKAASMVERIPRKLDETDHAFYLLACYYKDFDKFSIKKKHALKMNYDKFSNHIIRFRRLAEVHDFKRFRDHMEIPGHVPPEYLLWLRSKPTPIDYQSFWLPVPDVEAMHQVRMSHTAENLRLGDKVSDWFMDKPKRIYSW